MVESILTKLIMNELSTECPVCYEVILSPLKPQVCENGHVTCNLCYEKIDKCPICRVWLVRCQLMTALYTDNPKDQLEAMQSYRKLLSGRYAPIDEIIKKGLVTRFVELLRTTDNEILQCEAAWALSNIAFGTSIQTRSVIDAGAVPILVDLVLSEQKEVQEIAIITLGNIAADCPEFKAYVLDKGLLPPLLGVLNQSLQAPLLQPFSLTRIAVRALLTVCNGNNPSLNITNVFTVLSKFLFHYDPDILYHTCLSLSNLSNVPNNIQKIIESGGGVCNRIVELLRHNDEKVVEAALSVVGKIVSYNDRQTQVIINCGALLYLQKLLFSLKESIRESTCFHISNITAGNQQHIQAVIDANIFPALFEIKKRAEFNIRKEAEFAIRNAYKYGTVQQIKFLQEAEHIMLEQNHDPAEHRVPEQNHDQAEHSVPEQNYDVAEHTVLDQNLNAPEHAVPEQNHDAAEHSVSEQNHDAAEHSVPEQNHDVAEHAVPEQSHDASECRVPEYNHDVAEHIVPEHNHDAAEYRVPEQKRATAEHSVLEHNHDAAKHRVPE